MITLRCRLTSEDYLRAFYLHTRFNRWLPYLSLALVILGVIVYMTSSYTLEALVALIRGLAPVFFFSLVGLSIYCTIMPRCVRRFFSHPRTVVAEYSLLISPETIETIYKNTYMRTSLSNLKTYKINRHFVLLYNSQGLSGLSTIIPRRSFASEEDLQTFLSYLEDNLVSQIG